MIRVNLLRPATSGISTTPMESGSTSFSSSFGAGGDEQKIAGAKIAVIAIFPLLLFAYEYSNTSSLKDQIAASEKEASAYEAKKIAFGDTAPKVEKFTKLKKKIDSQMVVIRGLTKNRLREVKALDSLQEMTPPDVWYDKMTMDDGKVVLVGNAKSRAGYDALFNAMRTSAVFSNFEPVNQDQTKDATGADIFHFEFHFNVGSKAEHI